MLDLIYRFCDLISTYIKWKVFPRMEHQWNSSLVRRVWLLKKKTNTSWETEHEPWNICCNCADLCGICSVDILLHCHVWGCRPGASAVTLLFQQSVRSRINEGFLLGHFQNSINSPASAIRGIEHGWSLSVQWDPTAANKSPSGFKLFAMLTQQRSLASECFL